MSDKLELYQPGGKNLKGLMAACSDQIARVAASNLSPERLTQVVASLYARDDKLSLCTPLSVLHCVMASATLGLLPGTTMQQCYFIPRKNKVKRDGREVWEWQATFQTGYRGELALVRRSGDIGKVVVELVPKDEMDAFSLDVTEEVPIRFTRSGSAIAAEVSASDLAQLEAGYGLGFALVEVRGVGWQYAYMSVADISRTALASGSKRDGKLTGPWTQWADQMAKKTVLRRALKLCPMTDDVYERVGVAETEAPHRGLVIDVPGVEPLPEDEDEPAPDPKAQVRKALKKGAEQFVSPAEVDSLFSTLDAELGIERAKALIPDPTRATAEQCEIARDELARAGV